MPLHTVILSVNAKSRRVVYSLDAVLSYLSTGEHVNIADQPRAKKLSNGQ